ncbi:MAG: MerR family transcriptional regulator [Culicoidibacterales bacterium]
MLTMKKMEKETGLTSYTLRYYEKEEIIIPKRLGNDRRAYTEADVKWILFVKQLRELNITIDEIRQYALLIRQGEETIESRIQFLETHNDRIKMQIKALNEAEKLFTRQVQQLKKDQKKYKKTIKEK